MRQATQSILLLHVTGEDKPGITAALTTILGRQNIEILDVNQTVIHKTLLLGMMVRVPSEVESTAVLKDLLFAAHHAELRMRIAPVDDEQYDAWVSRQGKPRFILTLLARRLGAAHLAAVSSVLAEQGMNIDIITRLSGRPPREDDGQPRRACVEMSVRGQPADDDALRARLMTITQEHPIDIAWQRDTVYRRIRRLVAFDMDSTLIRHEVIDELARDAGVYEKVSAITEAAMRGEIDFDQSLSRRVALLKGPAGIHPRQSCRAADDDRRGRAPGHRPEEFWLQNRHHLRRVSIFSGSISRKSSESITSAPTIWKYPMAFSPAKSKARSSHAQRKAELLKEIAAQENISLQQTIAVGDGANDLPMLAVAGLGIAFHAKPMVAKSARHQISTLGLDSILYLIGVRDRDLLDVKN